MLIDAIQYLLDMLLQPFAAVLLLRFHLQWLRAPLRNPLGEFIMALTDFLVLRVRRYIPPLRGYDSASLLLALFFEAFYLSAYIWLQGVPANIFPVPGLLVWALVGLLQLSIILLMGSVIAEAILSWVNPHTPFAPLLAAINRPFVTPLRRHIPPLGQFDLSPLLLLIICKLILMLPLAVLESWALRYLVHA
jgi:YggT family protein